MCTANAIKKIILRPYTNKVSPENIKEIPVETKTRSSIVKMSLNNS